MSNDNQVSARLFARSQPLDIIQPSTQQMVTRSLIFNEKEPPTPFRIASLRIALDNQNTHPLFGRHKLNSQG